MIRRTNKDSKYLHLYNIKIEIILQMLMNFILVFQIILKRKKNGLQYLDKNEKDRYCMIECSTRPAQLQDINLE